MILLFIIQFADTGLRALISNGIIPEDAADATDVAQIRFVLDRRRAHAAADLPTAGHLR